MIEDYVRDNNFVWCDECLYNGVEDCGSPHLHHWDDGANCGIRTIDNEIEILKLKTEAI